MSRERARRSDSAESAVIAAQNAAQATPEPPEHVTLPDEARPFWDALMANRPWDRWNDADLSNAAILAVTQLQVHRLLGDVEHAALVDKLTRRIISLSRLLHVHPEATQGRAREQGKKLAIEKRAGATVHHLIPVA